MSDLRTLATLVLATSLTSFGCARAQLQPRSDPPATQRQAASPVTAVPSAPLRILLTNDDGIDAAGITALHRALAAHPSRYDVTVVAPASDRSGSGMGRSGGNLPVVRRSPHSWAVAGTPADCVVGALAGILGSPPDLVVSGMNDGANLGRVALTSGTVGAAMTAAAMGLPAIAVSVGTVDAAALTTREVFPDAAALTLQIIDTVARAGALKPRMVLSVNYPAVARERIRGLLTTPQSGHLLKIRRYTLVRSGTYRPDENRMLLVRQRSKRLREPPSLDTDTAAFAQGFVTITPMDGDWTAEDALGPLSELMSGFASP